MEVKVGDERILTQDLIDYYTDGFKPRVTPAGSRVRVVSVEKCHPSDRGLFCVLCPGTHGAWFMTAEMWFCMTREVRVYPADIWKDEEQFKIALEVDREKTLYALFRKVVDEWECDSETDIAEILARWAIEGVNLNDDVVIHGMTERFIEER